MNTPRTCAKRRGEAGQTVVLFTVLLMGLLGAAGLAIDYGFWALNKNQVQSAADASALAGASQIPAGQSSASSTASAQYLKNGAASGSVAVSPATNLTANDSVTVNASRDVATWFTGVFGVHSVTVKGSATATIESFTTVNGVNVMPWGVLKASYVTGQAYPIYTKDTGNANNGALSLPYVQSASCPVPNGANIYSDEIAGTTPVCPVSVGETLNTKPGNNAGPTAQGLNIRITTWQSLNQIVQFNADGTTTLLQPNSPQLIVIPVLTNPLRPERMAQRYQQPDDGCRLRLVRDHQLRRPSASDLLREQRRQAGERRVRQPRHLGQHGHARPLRPQLQHRLHRRAHQVARMLPRASLAALVTGRVAGRNLHGFHTRV